MDNEQYLICELRAPYFNERNVEGSELCEKLTLQKGYDGKQRLWYESGFAEFSVIPELDEYDGDYFVYEIPQEIMASQDLSELKRWIVSELDLRVQKIALKYKSKIAGYLA